MTGVQWDSRIISADSVFGSTADFVAMYKNASLVPGAGSGSSPSERGVAAAAVGTLIVEYLSASVASCRIVDADTDR